MTAPMANDTHAVLEELSHDTCLTLLGGERIGRLAVSWATGPLVVPVNYALDGETIVFRSDTGTKLRAVARRPVSFQVDHFDLSTREGWSVLARGRAREVSGRQLSHLPVDPWGPEGKDHWVAIKISSLSGRRISAGPPPQPA